MKFSIVSSVVFLVSCGNTIDIKDNGSDNKVDAKADVEVYEGSSEEDSSEALEQEEEVEDTMGEAIAEYHIQNDSALTDVFVSQDYCSGVSFRECRIKSLVLKEFEGGEYLVSVEWEDTFTDQRYFILKERLNETRAMRLSDDTKMAYDDSFDYRALWVVIDLDHFIVDVRYDIAGAGPTEQGSDLVDTYNLMLIED